MYLVHKRLTYGNRASIITCTCIQYIPRNMHTVFALLCFVVVIHWLIFPYPSGLLHWHCGNLTIAPVPAKQPWWIWINTSCEFFMNDCITTKKQSTTKPCAYFLGYSVGIHVECPLIRLYCMFSEDPPVRWKHICCVRKMMHYYLEWSLMSWKRHGVESSSAILALCEGNPTMD